MAALSRVFFDTGILVGGTIELGDSSQACHRVLDAIAEGRLREPVTAWHCCLELFSVLTRLPQEYRLDPADALRLLEKELLARFEVLALPSGERGPFSGGRSWSRPPGGGSTTPTWATLPSPPAVPWWSPRTSDTSACWSGTGSRCSMPVSSSSGSDERCSSSAWALAGIPRRIAGTAGQNR